MNKASESNNIVLFHRSNVTHINQWDTDTTVSEFEDLSIHLWYLTPTFSCNIWRKQLQADAWHIVIHDCSTALHQLDRVVFEATLIGTMHDATSVVETVVGVGNPCWVNYNYGFGVWLYRWYDSMAGEWIELQARTAD